MRVLSIVIRVFVLEFDYVSRYEIPNVETMHFIHNNQWLDALENE